MKLTNNPIVTADIFDLHHAELSLCELQFRSFGRRKSFYGPCATIKVFEDHSPVLEILETPGSGRVIVVDAGASLRVGVMGDRVAAAAVKNGWIGAIIFGAIRDSAGINRLDFGVKALGTTARRGWVQTSGERGISVTFGAGQFEPGDWVYADEDCVVVSKTELMLPAGEGALAPLIASEC